MIPLSLLLLQVLVIFTSMVVVAFVTLLQNPVLGSPTWLPLLGGCWAVAFFVTMLLQASLPLPDIQRYVAPCAPVVSGLSACLLHFIIAHQVPIHAMHIHVF
jgi:hypothetical protein